MVTSKRESWNQGGVFHAASTISIGGSTTSGYGTAASINGRVYVHVYSTPTNKNRREFYNRLNSELRWARQMTTPIM